MSSPLRFGIALPHTGSLGGRRAIARAAGGAEELQLDSVWVLERLLRPIRPAGAILPDVYKAVYSPLETLAFVAAITETVRIGTSVLVTAFHSPIMLARQLATLDQLSNGRLLVGLGQGHSREEFDAVHAPTDRRGARFEEFVKVLRTVWGPDPVAFAGRFFEFPASDMSPKPFGDTIQLLVGAMSPGAASRAGRLHLGLNPLMPEAWETLAELLSSYRTAAERAGADLATLPVVLRVSGHIRPDNAPGPHPPLSGPLSKVAADVNRAHEMGVTEIFYDMARFGVDVDEQLRLTADLRERVS